MNEQERLNALEDRILDLEFKRLKKEHARQSILVTSPKPPAKSAWQLRVTRLSRDKKKYQFRSASGAWTTLPADRKKWPAEVRETCELVEKIDKERMRDNRLVSNCRPLEEPAS